MKKPLVIFLGQKKIYFSLFLIKNILKILAIFCKIFFDRKIGNTLIGTLVGVLAENSKKNFLKYSGFYNFFKYLFSPKFLDYFWLGQEKNSKN